MNDELNALLSQMKLYCKYERATKAKERNALAAIDNDEVSSDDDFDPNNERTSLQLIPIPQDYERPAAQDPQFITQQTYERPIPQEYVFPTNDDTSLFCSCCPNSMIILSSEELS